MSHPCAGYSEVHCNNSLPVPEAREISEQHASPTHLWNDVNCDISNAFELKSELAITAQLTDGQLQLILNRIAIEISAKE